MGRAWAASGSVRMLNSATAERLPVVIAPPISTTRRNLRLTCSEPMRSCCIRRITLARVLESISIARPRHRIGEIRAVIECGDWLGQCACAVHWYSSVCVCAHTQRVCVRVRLGYGGVEYLYVRAGGQHKPLSFFFLIGFLIELQK